MDNLTRIKMLSAQCNLMFKDLSAIIDLLGNSPNVEVGIVNAKSNRIERMIDKFDMIEVELIELNFALEDIDEKINVTDLHSKFHAMIENAQALVYRQLNKENSGDPKPTSSLSNHAIGLKHLELPVLQGSEDFPSWMEIFNNLVHNNSSLSGAIKYNYLLSSVSLNVKKLISSFLPLDATNYEIALDYLKDHFDNKRLAVSTVLNKIINHDKLKSNRPGSEFSNLVQTFNQSVASLKAMKISNLSDIILFQILYGCLDDGTRRAFDANQRDLKEIKTVDELLEFLNSRVQVYELEKAVKPQQAEIPVVVKKNRPQALIAETRQSESKPNYNRCVLGCTEQHRLYRCVKFLKFSVPERQQCVKENRLCYSCFCRHRRENCESKNSCRSCGSVFHNTLLCKNSDKGQEPPGSRVQPSTVAAVTSSTTEVSLKPETPVGNKPVLSCISNVPQTLLSTALVHSVDIWGKKLKLRAVVDSGSHLNFVSEKAAQLLGFPRSKDRSIVSGIAGTCYTKGKISLQIGSIHNDFAISIDALILPRICNDLPTLPMPGIVKDNFLNLPLADSNFDMPSHIDLLLGASVYSQILSDDNPMVRVDGLVAQYTKIGYLLCGETATSLLSVDQDLQNALERLWSLEELPKPKFASANEELAETIYVSTTTRKADGSYIVKLPFRPDAVALHANKYSPMRSYLNLETRLAKTPEVSKLYNKFFQDYLEDGMMVLAKESVAYKLPHHAVLKDSTSTRVRPVFNGSSPDIFHHCLNEQLLSGPSLHSDIYDVLLSFRFQPIPLTCDIRRMYNSVHVHPDHWKYQHILWRPSPSEEVQEYALTRVTFGQAPSGFLAQRTIEQLVKDEGKELPLASNALLNQRYVDDVAVSCSDLVTAHAVKAQLIKLTSLGGFELRKFASSVPELTSDLPPEHCEDVDFDNHDASLKILGLAWTPSTDCFRYNVHTFTGPLTKRGVLSYAARLFDVKGFLTPIAIAIRAFIKKLWEAELDWDEQLSLNLSHEWQNYSNQMSVLQKLCIPRFIPVHQAVKLELIGFCDGSSIAHAACIYLRCIYNDYATMHLIRSKGRVNPSKPLLTIPRAELQGAKLLTDLYQSLLPRLEGLPISQTVFLTDSTIVLAWLNMPPNKLQLFVGNRISYIQNNTDIKYWRFIPTAFNCADPGSRGLSPEEMLNCELWWKGPIFLQTVPTVWPSLAVKHNDIEIPEMKAMSLLVFPQFKFDESIIRRFSSFSRMQMIIAWVMRYMNNLKAKIQGETLNKSKHLSVAEIRSALELLILKIQQTHFSCVFSGGTLPDKLKVLSPYVHSSGYVRLGGRINNAPISFDRKHPLLLPRESYLSKLICEHYHKITLHGGPLAMRSAIQGSYWIIGIGMLIRSAIKACLTCYKLLAKSPEPLMADLPKCRFTQVKAFYCSSMDYCGPFQVKEGVRPRARIIKIWVCVFTCLSVRAVHLELVESLSTEAFMACYSRFQARRGKIFSITCDHGSGFVGASRNLNEARAFLISNGSEIERLLAQKMTKMTFTCQAAPWKNGVTERLVGTFKNHLKRVLNNSVLTFVEFQTLTIQIESVMNSRPLLPLSVDPNDAILTPGHFLTGDSLLSLPEPDLTNLKLNTLSRWQLVKSYAQRFWKLWRNYYLQTLLTRSKWVDPSPNLKPGMVVAIKHENTPPLSWPLGLIENVFPHSDGVTRVVEIRLASGIRLTRAVNKVVPLKVQSDSTSD